MQSLLSENQKRVLVKNARTSFRAVFSKLAVESSRKTHVFVLNDKEEAAFFYNDLETLFEESSGEKSEKRVLFFPSSYKSSTQKEKIDATNVWYRTDVIHQLISGMPKIVVTYPEALSEKTVAKEFITQNTFAIQVGEIISIDILLEFLHSFEYRMEDFVFEPGQFAWRGGIIDIFSYSNDYPYRLELDNERVISMRYFDPATQRSLKEAEQIEIFPNAKESFTEDKQVYITENIPQDACFWFSDLLYCNDKSEKDLMKRLLDFQIVEFDKTFFGENVVTLDLQIEPQMSFNKSFELLLEHLIENKKQNYRSFIASDNEKQIERIKTIINDLVADKSDTGAEDLFAALPFNLHEGFIDKMSGIAVYTEHQIFDRYKRYALKEKFTQNEALTIKEIYNLQPGDYVTHIDHGVGKYSGLEKIEVGGKTQEAIRLIYKDNDILYISIHALHKISKYVGKDGAEPTIHRLGSGVWAKVKEQTKRRVKELAFDLIKLYAERKHAEGFEFSPDNYLQTELEASFIYEDTPDQLKATTDVKKDMEEAFPMDRLICGDVGFGKTEIAIRAAFKAVCDSKQVAVLVPTTVLAFQHYNTFKERLENFPCTVEFVNRFKSAKEQKEILEKLKAGKIDILIGTHRLISKDVEFKDLGLLIIDEEQKFGVGAKEKIRSLKLNVDTLALSATPIPRTLQLSLMGARDISVLATPPPNRYPIQTELHTFNEDLIREAVTYEIDRGGQVFVIHNQIKNIQDVADMIARLVPDVRIAVGHGRMEGDVLERLMIDFVNGEYDVLVATTIIESGIDIPNVNTIIVYEAQNFALNVLHQLRGRVGRMNKKAFCYLIAPPLSVLTEQAKKRLQAIEDFSELGSGFNIAMRDLDIRGAGDVLGADQSGFISEIGFEMYQKILAEALDELQEEDESGQGFKTPGDFIREVTIETDLGILIPDEYVSNLNERMNLYKEINDLNREEDIAAFMEKLLDRFGAIPPPTQELLNTVRLRTAAKHIGFERVVLKNKSMVCFFTSKQDSKYYESQDFQKMLEYITAHPKSCRLKESNQKLSLTFDGIGSVNEALVKLEELEIA